MLICRAHIAQFPAFYFIFIKELVRIPNYTSFSSQLDSLVSSHLVHVFHLSRNNRAVQIHLELLLCTTTLSRFGSIPLSEHMDFVTRWACSPCRVGNIFKWQQEGEKILLNPCVILAWFIGQIYCIFFFLDVTCQGSNKSLLPVSPSFFLDWRASQPYVC